MAVYVEEIVERGMSRGEFLQVAHPSKPAHRAFPPAQGQVTILRSVVEMTTDLLAVAISYLFHCGTIRPKPVRDDRSWRSVSLPGFLQKPKCSGLIPGFGDVTFEYFTFVIDSPPEIVLDAINLHKDLIKVPLPLSLLTHV